MERLGRVGRWLFIAFGVIVVALLATHFVLRANPELAASEEYRVLSAYIEANLTGESHELGSGNLKSTFTGRIQIYGDNVSADTTVNCSTLYEI